MRRKRRGWGEGAIFFREDKELWCTEVSLGLDARGRRKRRTVYGKTKSQVKEKLQKLQQNVLTGLPVEPQRITVREHFEDWLRDKKAKVRRSTYGSYERLYRNHIEPNIGGLKLIHLDYRKVNALYALLDAKVVDGDLSARTVAYVAWILRSCLDDAVTKGLIVKNPARIAGTRTYRREEARFLNQDEMRLLGEALEGNPLENLFTLMLHTGLRPGEAMGLSWANVDMKKARIDIRQALHEDDGEVYLGPLKTKAAYRTLQLSTEAVQALKQQRKRQIEKQLESGGDWENKANLVFTDTAGGLLRRTNVQRRELRRALDRARRLDAERAAKELRPPLTFAGVTLHTFRHTHASLLIFSGVDIKTVQRRLGHENVTITLQTYGHLLPGQDERAAQAVDEFFRALRLGKA